MVFITPYGSIPKQTITLGFKASNNEAEYEGLLADVQITKDLAVKKLAIHSDSQLIQPNYWGVRDKTSKDGTIPRECTQAT